MELNTIIEEIKRLKKEKNTVIIAHNYQSPEIQDIADIVGDSFQLSKEAAETNADIIVFCGVKFMAESAKILSPNKKVLLPVLDAGCPMADMITVDELIDFKSKYPGLPVVCYVNTSAEVKAHCDVVCTSSNAVKIIKAFGAKKLLFIPDKNLADFVRKQVPEVEILPWKGFCPAHERVETAEVRAMKAKFPEVPVLVHPECNPAVVQLADFVGSTAQIIQAVRESDALEFIIGTETGILHTLKKENPDKKFYLMSPALLCPDMKSVKLEDVYYSLRDEKHEVELNEKMRLNAHRALEKMLSLDTAARLKTENTLSFPEHT